MSRDKSWTGRVWLDQAIKNQVENDLEKMVYACLGSDRLEITKGEFDPYVSCKSSLKGICPLRSKRKFMGYIKPGGYAVFSDTKLGIYLEVLRILLSDQVAFPVR